MAKPVKRLYLELSNACNFSCDFCPSTVSTRASGSMDFTLFTRVVDQAVEERVAKRLALHVLGEPLLYPCLVEAVEYAASRSLSITLTTNGSLLTSALVDDLARAGLDELDISLETLDPTQHGCRHSGLELDEYYSRILEAVTAVARHPNLRLRIDLMNTATKKYFRLKKRVAIKQPTNELKEQIVRLVGDIRNLLGVKHDSEQLRVRLDQTRLNKTQRLRVTDQIYIYIQMFIDWGNAWHSHRVVPPLVAYCGYAINYAAVLHDGTVTACCADFDGQTALGNVHNQSLGSILRGDEARAIKDGFHRWRIVHRHCRRCLGSSFPVIAQIKGITSILLFKYSSPHRDEQISLD